MKKFLILLTGIVFLTTALVAGGCSSTDDPGLLEDLDKVEIYCEIVETGGAMHFIIYDSNDTIDVVINPANSKVDADLETIVEGKTKVTWIWTDHSEIDKFVKIGPIHPNGKIIPGNAKRVPFTNKLRLKIPKDATTGSEEYDIQFVDTDGDTVTIDPYLKIR